MAYKGTDRELFQRDEVWWVRGGTARMRMRTWRRSEQPKAWRGPSTGSASWPSRRRPTYGRGGTDCGIRLPLPHRADKLPAGNDHLSRGVPSGRGRAYPAW